MIDIGDAGRALLDGSRSARYVVSSFYGADLTLADLPFDPAQSSISFDATAQTQGTGTLWVVSQGESLRPRSKTDPLAAYGQEVGISYIVGDQVNISLGRFRITDVPSAQEMARINPFAVTGSIVELTLADRLDIIVNDSFLSATAPQETSAWAEVRRISPIQIVQSLPDVSVPSSLVYQNKFDAIKKLMQLMGGEPALTREGALTARLSSSWAQGLPPVATIRGVISREDGMSNSLFNCIVVTNANDATIQGVAQIDNPGNPLNVYGPLGRRVKTIQDPLATTNQIATETAQTYLKQYSTQQTQSVKITCLPRWDLELGDVVEAVDPVSGETIIGAIQHMEAGLDPTAAMTIDLTEVTS